jgi:hypothetical protein
MMSDVGLRVVGVNEDFAGLATMMLRGLMAGFPAKMISGDLR